MGRPKICLVSCSVLKQEIQQLAKQGMLGEVELVFVSKYFHVDYEALKNNLHKVLEKTQKRFKGKVVLVYGDLCLGQDNEMKKLADEFRVVKIDAVNCIDCQLGGKGIFFEADPDHNLMFMGPGMIGFFKHAQEIMLKEGLDKEAFANMFSGIKGIVLLDTCGDKDKCRQDIEKVELGLKLLEIKQIGLDNVKRVIMDAIERASGIS